MRLLITGGCGFIGSALVRHLIYATPHEVVNLDALTYAGDSSTVAEVATDPRYRFVHGDVCDGSRLAGLLAEVRPEAILHLAAESHVDRSIDGPGAFVQTNVVGTQYLLEAARGYWQALDADAAARFRFIHVSTDEVFGSLGPEGAFTEASPYRPNSPYAASKAAADHLARAWHRTYGLPVIISNCSNNYGPYQLPEKLIPLVLAKALAGESLPIYGAGAQVRDWLFVEDHVDALVRILRLGTPGETYAVGGGSECSNLVLVQGLCAILDELAPRADGKHYAAQIAFVADRPGHDFRYAIDPAKAQRELGWRPAQSLDTGLRHTVRWYLRNQSWYQAIAGERYTTRLGLTARSASP